MPIEDPDWVRGELNRDELYRKLEEQGLEGFLDEIQGRWGKHLDGSIAEFGGEITQAVNVGRRIDFKEPLEAEDLIIGYRTLLYEAVNEISIEDELGQIAKENEE